MHARLCLPRSAVTSHPAPRGSVLASRDQRQRESHHMLTTASAPLMLTAHGVEIPALGFGTSPMTGSMAADEVVAALKSGYRHIDAARKYGTENTVGEAMQRSGVPRKEIFLTTK